jgi:hypothetical protein
MPRLGARPLAGHPVRPVYEPVGKGDSYFPIVLYDAIALAYGHQQAGDIVWPSMQEALADAVDVIVVDTAPLLTTNDAAEILGLADMVVVAARADRTTGDAADRAAELLERRDAHVVGAVLVGARSGRSGRYYYYAQNSYYDGDTKGGGEASERSADETAIFDAGMASTPSGHPASPTEG